MTRRDIEDKSLNSLINLVFPPSFFNDEIREGFYIPEMMKRYWAGQLKVLSEIAKVCDKHDIPWFSDYGSLMGAVRHGGYIPWDDDFDICMLRHDYERFVSVAKEELPVDYQLLMIENEPEYDNMLGRVVNWNKINIGQERLKDFYGCPYTVGVDIFIMDGVSTDERAEDKRLELAKEVVDASKLIDEGKQDTFEFRKILSNIERQNQVIFHRGKNLRRELRLLSLKLYKKFSSETAEEVVFAPLWVNYHSHIFPKKFYKDYIYAKFENTEIRISPFYEELLKLVYGDYMKICRSGGVHDYPLYGEQEKILIEHIDGNKNPFRYKFAADTDKIIQENRSRRKFDVYAKEVIGIMKTVGLQLRELYSSEKYDVMYQLLEECQPMAISLGNEIEKRSGDHKAVIALLEKYCESVYICHESMADGTFTCDMLDGIEKLTAEIKKEIEAYLKNRKKRILFMPCSPMYWESMSGIYADRATSPDNECTVVPIPCYQKDLDEKIIGIVEDDDKYPSDIIMKTLDELGIDDTSLYDKLWSTLDFEKNHYDEIVIQFPFDGWNRSMTIPPQFCSDELVKHTDLLTYSPCLVPVFPEGGDAKLYTSLKTLVEQPTVIYSDTVILHSQQEKEAYQSIADELTGGKYTRYWNEKFSVINTGEDKKSISDNSACGQNKAIDRDKRMDELGLPGDFHDKKILLYHIGISSLLENKDCAVERLKETVSDITDNQDRIKCIFSPGKNVSELEHIDPDLWTKYKAFIDELSQDDRIYLDDKGDALAYIDIVDGYYGDGDVVAHRCRNKGIPVMIRKADMG